MNKKKLGKIIAVVGAPRSGKSFLAELIAEYYGGELFLEGEEADFPKRIKEDIEKNIRPLERIMWFRNKLVNEYLTALKYKRDGKIVVLDAFWFSYQLFIDVLTEGFENDVMHEMAENDKKMLSYPDIVVFLSVNEETIRKFIALGKRQFDRSDEYIINQALPVNELHQEFFAKNKNIPGKVITVQRDEMDFAKKEDFDKLINLIEE